MSITRTKKQVETQRTSPLFFPTGFSPRRQIAGHGPKKAPEGGKGRLPIRVRYKYNDMHYCNASLFPLLMRCRKVSLCHSTTVSNGSAF